MIVKHKESGEIGNVLRSTANCFIVERTRVTECWDKVDCLIGRKHVKWQCSKCKSIQEATEFDRFSFNGCKCNSTTIDLENKKSPFFGGEGVVLSVEIKFE